MNKAEKRECDKVAKVLPRVMCLDEPMIGYAARSLSALARSSLRSRNEIITFAAQWPFVVQHQDFIVA